MRRTRVQRCVKAREKKCGKTFVHDFHVDDFYVNVFYVNVLLAATGADEQTRERDRREREQSP
jgi:hypothetical protein